MRHVAMGVTWGALYFAAAGAPLLVALWSNETRHSGFLWELGIGLGFGALGVLGTLFLLTARFRRITAPFGIDVLYYFHRWVGTLTAGFAVLHAAVLSAMEPMYWFALDVTYAVTASGAVALVALALIVLSSLFRKTLRIEYDRWRLLHASLAIVAATAAIWHVVLVGGRFGTPLAQAFLYAMAGAWAALVLYVRVYKPIRLRRTPYRVAEVKAERGNACSITLHPVGHSGFHFQPGQFAWLTLNARPWQMREHPFSIASSANSPHAVTFTIKALGDFTSTIRSIQPGEPAWLEGPYGAFTPDRYPISPLVLVAGGIGIVPIMSMLRTFADRGESRELRLIYAYRDMDSLTYQEEFEALRARLNLRIDFVLRDPPPNSGMPAGMLTAERFETMLPADCRACRYFVCGPKPIVSIVETTLRAKGVRANRLHVELFDWV